jgi:hypothetical protein
LDLKDHRVYRATQAQPALRVIPVILALWVLKDFREFKAFRD